MAKQKKTKTPKNVTRKIDVNKYTPTALINRGVTIKQQRKLYTEYRSIVNKRLNRLKEKGYRDVEEVKKIKLPTLKEIDEHQYSEQYFHFKLLEAINALNNPLTLLSNQENRTEIKIKNTLEKHGYQKAAKDTKRYGKFMDMIRARSIGLLYDSDRVAEWYEQEETKGFTPKELAQMYEEFQLKEDRTLYENIKLLHPKDYEERLAKKWDTTVEKVREWANKNI